MIRRLTSLIAAVALVHAMAAPPVSACESEHAPSANAGETIAGAMHSMHGASTEGDCPEPETPSGQEHDSTCLAKCLSMVGCSAPFFVADAALLSVIDQASPAPAHSPQSYPSRSYSPDRPPPRV